MEHAAMRDEITATEYEEEIRAANDARLRATEPYLWHQIQESNITNPAATVGKKVTRY